MKKEIDLNKIIDEMSLEQKIGQMFMGNICGGETIDDARYIMEKHSFGGLQFSGVFERFVRGGDYLECGVCKNRPLDEVAEFLAEIKKLAIEITGVPLIIGGDQEGGVCGSIFRRRNITLAPLSMGLGAADNLEDTYCAASIMAREVKALGLNMLYGPSLDINTNPKNPEIGARSFSEDPDSVAAHGKEVIRAYADCNMISNAKHFPGRGHGQANAHHDLESIDLDMARLRAVELHPFQEAINAGVDSIMMGHTLYPAFGGDNLPASLSPTILKFLREEMGFDGMVIPDTLTMFAISKNYDVPQACAMCLEAGSDMIFMKVPAYYEPTVEAIKNSIKAGRLTEERIEQSLLRIMQLKLKRGLFEENASSSISIVGCDKHVNDMTTVSQNSVLLLKNDNLLPLVSDSEKPTLVVVPRDGNIMLSNDTTLSHDLLPNTIKQYAHNVRYTVVDEAPTRHQCYEAVGLAGNAELVIFGIYSAGASPEQLALLNDLVELGVPVIVVITGSPYLAVNLPDKVKTIICSFGITPLTFQAVAGIMFGIQKPSATLPVGISKTMPKGFSVKL